MSKDGHPVPEGDDRPDLELRRDAQRGHRTSADDGGETPKGAGLRPLALALGLAMSSAMPMLLTGALAVQIQVDLGFGNSELGLALASFLVVSGVSSAPAGRLADRVGWHWMTAFAVCVTTASLLGAALVGTTYPRLVACLALGGVGQAIGQTTGNLVLARESPLGRRGLHFGVKQSAIPLGGLLAGLAVPAIGLTVGWRWAFGTATLIPILVATFLLSRPPSVNARPRPRGEMPRGNLSRSLFLLALGISLGACSVGSLGFLAVSGVDGGLSPAQAGFTIAGASAAGLAARVLLGWLVDVRRSDGLGLVVVLLVLGAGAFALLALHVPPAIVLGAGLAYSAGWGWPGVLLHGVVWHHREAPGAATGLVGVGTAGGAAVGPPLFGTIAEFAGFPAAWLTSAALAVGSALVVTVAVRGLRAGSGPPTLP